MDREHADGIPHPNSVPRLYPIVGANQTEKRQAKQRAQVGPVQDPAGLLIRAQEKRKSVLYIGMLGKKEIINQHVRMRQPQRTIFNNQVTRTFPGIVGSLFTQSSLLQFLSLY